MAFFARPNLDNVQFKQLDGSVLTLSGQTQIATTSGLTLYGGMSGGTPYYIPIIATNADNFDVLTYCNGIISLQPSSASGGTGIYDGSSPTTCSVGGLSAGTTIYGSGYTALLQCILVPTLNPTLTNPSISSFTIAPTTTLYEVGTDINITTTTNFNAGCINPQYTAASNCRSDGASGYSYGIYGNPPVFVSCPNPTSVYAFPSHIVTAPSNTLSVFVNYCCGAQPKDSSGANYCSPLSASATTTCNKTITGVYPWYWGKVTCAAAAGVGRPDKACIKHMISGGTATKVVGLSNTTLNVTFGSTASDYIWFAIPSCGGVGKTCWYVDALNNQAITGPVSPGGCLFPAYNASTDLITGATSAQGCWSIPQDYKMYVSNYQSAAVVNMQLRNS